MRRTILSVAWCVALAVPASGRTDTRSAITPTGYGGSVSIGYEWNILGSSRAEEAAFGSDDSRYFFVVDRLDDYRGEVGAWVRWDLPSFHKKVRTKLEYARREHLREEILGSNQVRLSLRQRLPDRSHIELTFDHKPQVYLRHRVDKDAPPGDPRFRPEAVRETAIELEYGREVGKVPVVLSIGYEEEDRTEWFNERDEESVTAGIAARFALGESIGITARTEHTESRSRNRPDLGSDRSYRQPAVGLRLDARRRTAWGTWRIEAGTRWKFRTYTTADPEDESRYGRSDRLHNWSAKISRATAFAAPFLAVEGSGRAVDLPAGADASDEEGEYGRSLIRVGVDWER